MLRLAPHAVAPLPPLPPALFAVEIFFSHFLHLRLTARACRPWDCRLQTSAALGPLRRHLSHVAAAGGLTLPCSGALTGPAPLLDRGSRSLAGRAGQPAGRWPLSSCRRAVCALPASLRGAAVRGPCISSSGLSGRHGPLPAAIYRCRASGLQARQPRSPGDLSTRHPPRPPAVAA